MCEVAEPVLLALCASLLMMKRPVADMMHMHAQDWKLGAISLTCLSLYKSCSSEVDTLVAAGAPRRLRCLRFDPDAMPLRAACTVTKPSQGVENSRKHSKVRKKYGVPEQTTAVNSVCFQLDHQRCRGVDAL